MDARCLVWGSWVLCRQRYRAIGIAQRRSGRTELTFGFRWSLRGGFRIWESALVHLERVGSSRVSQKKLIRAGIEADEHGGKCNRNSDLLVGKDRPFECDGTRANIVVFNFLDSSTQFLDIWT